MSSAFRFSRSSRGVAKYTLALSAMLLTGCGDVEPTADEMRGAVERDLSGRGNTAGRPNEARIDNPLNGITVSAEDFEKLGCVAAQNKPGYVCDYRITIKTSFHSNEGSADGAAHAQAVTTLMTILNGGRPLVQTTAVTARFVKTNGEWIRLPE